MPLRQTPLISGSYYHVFNRGINRQPTFTSPIDYYRATLTLRYYQHQKPTPKLSHFLAKSKDNRSALLNTLDKSPRRVSIVAYCFMPNHFHLLLKQNDDLGIQQFLSDFQNSYTKYYNAKHNRSGSLFNRQFKALLVETENQLLHLARYIHLNPYSSSLISKNNIITYPWSSISQYINQSLSPIVDKSYIPYVKNQVEFVMNHADFQQSLEKAKHLLIDI